MLSKKCHLKPTSTFTLITFLTQHLGLSIFDPVKTCPEQRQETLLAVSEIFIDFQIKNTKKYHKQNPLKVTLLPEVPHQNSFHRQTYIPLY